MSPGSEDKLRRLLQDEAATVHPAGDGLARIQARLARRRRLRWWLLPSAGLATAAAVVAAVLVLPSDDTRRPDVLVPGTPTPGPTASVGLLPGSHRGSALWPVTLAEEGRAWDGGEWVQDPERVVERFVSDFLHLQGVTVRQECVSCQVLQLQVAGTTVGEAHVVRYAWTDLRQVWAVTGVTAPRLTVTSPVPDQPVDPTFTVTGEVPGVDESVALSLRSAPQGRLLAQASAPAGGEAPWQAALSRDWEVQGTAALVAVTRSPRDGAVTSVHVQPLSLVAMEPPRFAALVDGHVSLFDAASGDLVRRVTYPPAGTTDAEAAYSHRGGVTLWVRRGSADCTDELNRAIGRAAITLVKAGRARLSSPQVSPDGDLQAWVEQSCTDPDEGAVVVTVNGTGPRRLATPTGSVTRLLDVRDDGALLVLTNDREASGHGAIGLVPAGATRLDGLVALEAEPGCYLASGAAFDGNRPIAFQTCEDGIQLLRFDGTGRAGTKDPALTEESPSSVTVHAGQVLVWRHGGDTVGAVARYEDGRLTDLTRPDPVHCASDGDQRGCVRAPDW